MIGALLNAAYEADGAVQGCILFLLDEVARLGPMAVLEAARDAGRKYGLTLLLLYQSVGQLVEQWGREGARELSQVCGEHGVVASSEGSTRGTSGRWGGATSSSSGQSASRSEMRRPLIKLEELLQDTASARYPRRQGSRHHLRRQVPALRSPLLLPRPEMVQEVMPGAS